MRHSPPAVGSTVRLFVAGGFALFVTYALFTGLSTGVGWAQKKPSVAKRAPNKYSRFSHRTEAHQKDCKTCHVVPTANWISVRPESEAFPDIADYPKHDTCITCHRDQFFTGRPPQICSICHQTPSPEGGARFPFPNPRELFDRSPKALGHESAFAVFFPHDKHIGIVSGIPSVARGGVFANASFRADEASCSVCHTTVAPQGDSPDEFISPPAKGSRFWLKKGTFKSAPTGHKECFTCHLTDSGMAPEPADCGTCHRQRPESPGADLDPVLAERIRLDRASMLMWRARISSGRFRHGSAMHTDLECSTCHSVASINTLDPVSSRVPIATCAMCHATATVADGGGLNLEVESRKKDPRFECVMCHITFGRLPVPESHTQALAMAAQ